MDALLTQDQPKGFFLSTTDNEEKDFLFKHFDFFGNPENGDVLIKKEQKEIVEEFLEQEKELDEDSKLIDMFIEIIHYLNEYDYIVILTF